MLRHKILALAMGLTLTGAGLRADDARQEARPDNPVVQQAPPAGQTPQVPPTNQSGISVNPPGREQPVTAPTTPAPTAPAVPLIPTDTPQAQQPDAPGVDQQQNQPDQQQIQPDQQQNQPDQQQIQPDQQQVQPDQQIQSPADTTATDAQAQIDTQGMPVSLTPLQEFVSRQNHEIGTLSRQMDVFKAANRQDAVMATYHMIRDHVLVSDAAQNVLARRREISRPFPLRMDEPMAHTPEEVIRHQVQHHEQGLARIREMLANASTPEDRSILQQAANATTKHLNWLRAMDQGRQVQIGYFQPTTPLSRIAGYREQTVMRQRNQSGRQIRARRANQGGRNWRARRAR